MLEDLLKHGRTYSWAAALAATVMSAPAYSAERAPAGVPYAQQSRPNVYYIEPKPKREEPPAEEEEEKKEEEKETEKKPELEYSPPAEKRPREFEYHPPPPPPQDTRNRDNDVFGYILTIGGAGLLGTKLVLDFAGDDCPPGVQEGGVVGECYRKFEAEDYALYTLFGAALVAGIYLLLD